MVVHNVNVDRVRVIDSREIPCEVYEVGRKDARINSDAHTSTLLTW